MAALGGNRADRLEISNLNKSPLASPEKVRELLNEGVSSTESISSSLEGDPKVESNQNACEATNKEAFFSRVESYSIFATNDVTDTTVMPASVWRFSLAANCLKWAGKPRSLTPLICARYGWINVSPDMLKCSSCQAFLCATLQPNLDFEKYELRVAEISKQLQTQHEKFCSWPDFPCPERIWLVPACEPSVLLNSFLERFQSTCRLSLQLPALKTEQLKSMCLNEDEVSVLLQLTEEEQKRKGQSLSSEPLAVQVAACIVALCGWAASPALGASSLPILTCSFCKRKVGLWNFHQMEELSGNNCEKASPPISTVSTSAPGVPQDGQGDAIVTPTAPATPCRMKLRSQDSTRSDQGEGTNFSPQALRTKSRDSTSPTEELPSPRGKRPAPRTKGPGEAPSMQPTSKRLCLSTAGPDLLQKSLFDPLAQHRDWCPWVAVGKENEDTRSVPLLGGGTAYLQGWKAALDLLIPMKKNGNTMGSSPAQAREKSRRVFAIFQQWQVTPLSQ